MISDDEFNRGQPITPGHITEMTRLAQYALGLSPDGRCGPATRAALDGERAHRASTLPALEVVDGWLRGTGVTLVPAHASWHYPRLETPDSKPRAIVAHYTATDHGTAAAMAARRTKRRVPLVDRAASWHISIEGDGSILQMIPLICGAWHAGGKSDRPIPGIGEANRTAVGIELVGHGDVFPEPQVVAARRVWKAVCGAYGIARGVAMVTHQELDPTRKRDPGPLWMGTYAPTVLTYTYG